MEHLHSAYTFRLPNASPGRRVSKTSPRWNPYEGNGNLATKTAPAPNQTGSAYVTITYSYDPSGRRVAKTMGGTTTSYVYNLAGNVLFETQGSTSTTEQYMHFY